MPATLIDQSTLDVDEPNTAEIRHSAHRNPGSAGRETLCAERVLTYPEYDIGRGDT